MPKKIGREIKTIKPIKGYNQYGVYVEIPNSDLFKGIYAIGLDDPDETKQDNTIVKSKIGLGGLREDAGGLLERMRSYYIAYPDGYWIYCLLLTVEKDAKLLNKLETEIHDLLDKKRYKSKYLTNLRKSEWFRASIKQIRNAFVKVNKKYPKETFIIFPSEYEEEPEI
jgi:hypothetical protein